MNNDKYYIFCDESGNDNKHPIVGCVVIEKKKYDELLSIIKPKYLEYEKQNPKFEEIHFANFKNIRKDVVFAKTILQSVCKNIVFYSLILNEDTNNNNKKDRYYNILLNKALGNFDIKQFQIEKIVIDKYKKQDRQKIGNFECCFIDSKYKKSNSDYSYFIQICDCLIGAINYIKNNTKKADDRRLEFCEFICKIFDLHTIITLTDKWKVKEYKKS